MKNLFPLLGLTLLLALTFQANTAQACVDPDSTVIIIVNYDSTNAPIIDEVEIRITNLRMMNEAPNTICSCALTYWSDLFSNITYVAFVDSGTNTPYDGFSAFNNTPGVDQAWGTSPGGNWNGYIANVLSSGLTATDPVEMVIRATTPIGITYTLFGDSLLQQNSLYDEVISESLGTDAWDPINNELVHDHLSVKSFAPWAHAGNSITFTEQPMSYFTDLDNDILSVLNALPRSESNLGSLSAFPNPFHNQLNVQVNMAQAATVSFILYDVMGTEVWRASDKRYESGIQTFLLDASSLGLSKGVYILKLQGTDSQLTQRVVYN